MGLLSQIINIFIMFYFSGLRNFMRGIKLPEQYEDALHCMLNSTSMAHKDEIEQNNEVCYFL